MQGAGEDYLQTDGERGREQRRQAQSGSGHHRAADQGADGGAHQRERRRTSDQVNAGVLEPCQPGAPG